jgi:general secretion pathway protein G
VRRQGGLTAIEFAVVLLIFSLLLAGLSRVLGYAEEQAEKATVRYAVFALESGLKLEAVSRLTRGRSGDVTKLAEEDPFQWVDPKPKSFRGDWQEPAPGSQAESGWYWDRQRHELVYVLAISDRFKPGPSGRAEIRYRIEAGAGGPGDIRTVLRPVEGYQWF